MTQDKIKKLIEVLEKMKIEIELKDEKYCNGCPLRDTVQSSCRIKMGRMRDTENDLLYIRPERCIEENKA